MLRRPPNPQLQYGRVAPRQAVPRLNAMGILRGIRLGMLAAQGAVGSVLSPSQIQAYAANAGFTGDDLNTAVAIAMAESGGNPGAIGDRTLAPTRGPSYGLWQINIGSNANPQFASVNLFDPQTNANAAYSIYSAIGGFGTTRGWTTYTGGQYQAYLNAVPAAPDASQPTLTLDAATGQPVTDTTDVSQIVPALVASTSGSTIIPGIPDVAIYGGAALATLLAAKYFLD
jgi:hypothetical protein